MDNIYMHFNNMTNDDLGLMIKKRPVIPFSNMDYDTQDVKGKDGSYYIEKGLKDVVIPVEFNFVEDDVDNIRQRIRDIKKWLNNIKDNNMWFSYDSNYFYSVKAINLNDCDYEDFYEIENFKIDFTVEPYQFQRDGLNKILLNTMLYNFFDISHPVYRIEGNGKCDFTINGTTVNCNVNGSLTINTNIARLFENNGTYAVGKTNIKSFEDLYLIEGQNNFSWTNGFNIYITPNYRTAL